jgi:uncharacterized membrane protein YkvA (DUF1232 family)
LCEDAIGMVRGLIIVAISLVGLWLLFVLFVVITRPDRDSLRAVLRLLPDTLRLIRRLATDRDLPRSTRWLVGLLVVYLASPIDLIPDFIPVLGYADDAIVVSLVLRRVIRKAGRAKLTQHWPGTPDGLELLLKVLRISPATVPAPD